MASRDKHEEKGFFSRWSERKRATEEEAAQREAAPDADAPAPAAADDTQPVDPAELPDIDSLDASSDFTVFMRPGVPAALKQRALNRLWQVDPAFKHICMLDDYNLDYTDAATVVPNLKTIYQVGRGMVLDDPAEEEAAPQPPTQQVTAQSDSPPRESQAQEDAPGEPPATDEEPAQKPAALSRAPAGAESTPHRPAAAEKTQPAGRSARRRRWGDSETA